MIAGTGIKEVPLKMLLQWYLVSGKIDHEISKWILPPRNGWVKPVIFACWKEANASSGMKCVYS